MIRKGYKAEGRESKSEQNGKAKGYFGHGRDELNSMEWKQGDEMRKEEPEVIHEGTYYLLVGIKGPLNSRGNFLYAMPVNMLKFCKGNSILNALVELTSCCWWIILSSA